jgi:hypothetical protein
VHNAIIEETQMSEEQFFDKVRRVSKELDEGTYTPKEIAYDLAEKLFMLEENHILMLKASNMLRQQADRIAELEAKHKAEFDYAESLLTRGIK